MKTILLVDDEQHVLNALNRELRKYCDLESFDSPVVALERCREKQFDLVFSDYKMPRMGGLEFLKQLRQLQPDSSLMVLSGGGDINVQDYQHFVEELAGIYECCSDVMAPGRVLTIVTKYVKYERAQYPIAWDLVLRLCGEGGRSEYVGTTFWCQEHTTSTTHTETLSTDGMTIKADGTHNDLATRRIN